MITPTQMYWLVTLNSIIGLMFTLAVLGGITFIASMCYISETGDKSKRWLPVVSIVLMVAMMFGIAFTPSTRQMAAIVVVPKIANSEKVQTVGNKLYDLAVEWMDSLKPDNHGTK